MWRTIAGVVLLKKECNGVLGRRTERRKRDGETNREEGKQESRWGGEGKGKEREKEKGRNAGRRNEQGRR